MLAVGSLTPAPTPRAWRRELVGFAAVAALSFLLWCVVYNRWTASALRTPVMYSDDALSAMAFVKAMAAGEIAPLAPKFPGSLGAPYRANWNDFPTVEEAVFAWWALLARLFGISAASSFVLISAHVLAALAFYGVCRRLRYAHSFSAAGAMLFSFSPFAFYRHLQHLPLTYFWHIPLGLLVVWLCTREHKPPLRRHWLFCFAVAVLFGLQNPYYTGMFLQFLGLAVLWELARTRDWRRAILPLSLIAATGLAFTAANFDTLYTRATEGMNFGAVLRSYQNLEFYALKPVELLLPVAHRIDALQNWVRNVYAGNALFVGELGSPYLGWIALAGLIWMISRAFVAAARGRFAEVPPHLGAIVWIIGYSIVGGLNGLIGFKFQYFRATNRYSIFILCLILLFIVRELSRLTARKGPLLRGALAAAVLVVGLLDQRAGLPAVAGIKSTARQISSDRKIVQKVEAALPAGAMIFQLPVHEFPEGGSIREMGDHEHFRPYLFSKSLRFSYGSHKGRIRERWQAEAAGFGVERLVRTIESYGFSAVWINRKAYEDRGAALLAAFRAAGRERIIARSADFLCVALNRSPDPAMPPQFEGPWSGLEGDGSQFWRWSGGPAVITLHHAGNEERIARLSLGLAALQPRTITIMHGSEKVAESVLTEPAKFEALELTVRLKPGENRLRFETDRPGQVVGSGDPRSLAFRIVNFQVAY